MINTIKNLQAARAQFAFECVEAGNKNEDFNYSAAVQELPSLIRKNGLRASMAYLFSKDKAHRQLFLDFETWFREKEPTGIMHSALAATDTGKAKGFIHTLLHLKDEDYRVVQSEALALANWFIRFVNTEDATTNNQKDHDTK